MLALCKRGTDAPFPLAMTFVGCDSIEKTSLRWRRFVRHLLTVSLTSRRCLLPSDLLCLGGQEITLVLLEFVIQVVDDGTEPVPLAYYLQ